MSGKGSARRPTDDTAYSDGWARIFGNKERDAKDGDSEQPEEREPWQTNQAS